jgi:hypothetical protein
MNKINLKTAILVLSLGMPLVGLAGTTGPTLTLETNLFGANTKTLLQISWAGPKAALGKTGNQYCKYNEPTYLAWVCNNGSATAVTIKIPDTNRDPSTISGLLVSADTTAMSTTDISSDPMCKTAGTTVHPLGGSTSQALSLSETSFMTTTGSTATQQANWGVNGQGGIFTVTDFSQENSKISGAFDSIKSCS